MIAVIQWMAVRVVDADALSWRAPTRLVPLNARIHGARGCIADVRAFIARMRP